jgi:hypothetical protein
VTVRHGQAERSIHTVVNKEPLKVVDVLLAVAGDEAIVSGLDGRKILEVVVQ